MSRNPLIEAIHEARYDLETCAAREQGAFGVSGGMKVGESWRFEIPFS